jgi:CMP-2-keto-3-deoxyoctulosonic acid synthetase
MKRLAAVAAAISTVLFICGNDWAQTIVNPSGQRIVVAGQSAPAPPVANTSKLNEKQRILANEANQLLSMATELKQQVDMTNKNILSVKVVRQAEEIELYAHRLKGEAKR